MTEKQKRILRVLATACKAGKSLTMDQLIAEINPGKTQSKQAMQNTIRYMEAKDLLKRTYERREGRVNLVILPTRDGLTLGLSYPP